MTISAVALDHVVRYAFPSTVGSGPAGPRLALAGASDHAPAPFLEGELAHPEVVARLLRLVGQLAATRYHVPPGMLARVLAEADPIVTSGGDMVRFESFSACAGVYARLDLGPDALEARTRHPGTTNVDLGPALRAALAGVRRGRAVGLTVSTEALALDLGGAVFVERRVRLPVRWLRSLLVAQVLQSRLELRHEVARAEAVRFLRELPSRGGRDAVYVVGAGRGLRLASRPAPGAVPIQGIERLHALRDVAAFADRMAVYGDPSGGSSAWVLDHGHARLTWLASPSTWRGFSGEGQGLEALADPARDAALPRVRAALAWQAELDAASLAGAGLDPGAVAAALAALGSGGSSATTWPGVRGSTGSSRFRPRPWKRCTPASERREPWWRGARSGCSPGPRPPRPRSKARAG